MTESTVESSPIVVGLREKKPIRVLHVDDEPGLLKIAKECLETEGPFQVETVSSVDEALEKIKSGPYDAIISDYQMAGKDGLDFLKELRDSGNSVPFIMFTGKGREEVAMHALNLGANQYINKTGDPETVYCELAHGIQQAVQRNKAEERIRQSEEKYRNLFELAPDIMMTLDTKGVITSCNNAGLAISGYSRDEIVGKNFSKLDFLRIRDIPKYLTLFASIARGKIPEPMRVTWHSKDGSSLVSEFHVGLIKEGDKTVGIQVIGRDVTERKKAEENLRESEKKYREIFENANDVIVYVDNAGKIIDLNARAKGTLGYDRAELIGKNVFDSGLIDSKHLAQLIEAFKDSVTRGEIMATADDRINRMEVEMKHKRGHTVIVEASTQAIAENGNLQGFLSILRDVTGRKKAEFELQESEAKYRALVDQSLQGIVVAQGSVPHIIFANTAMTKILGYMPEELVSLSPQQTEGLVHPEDRELFFGRFKDRLEGRPAQSNYEVRGIRKDGVTVWLEMSSKRIEYNRQPAVQATFMDITERKKVDEAAQKSEERFKALMEEAPIGVCSADLDGKITYVNRRFEEVMGYSREEIVGQNSFEFGIMSDETSKLLQKRMKDRLLGKPNRVSECQFKRKDGEWIWAEVEGRLIKKLGAPAGFQLTVRDITERKKAEEERKRFEESLSALNVYGRDLNMARSMGEIYELVLNVAEKAFGFECADILLVEEKTLRVTAQRGYAEKLSLELPLDGDKGITVRAARAGKPVLVPDVSKDSAYVSFRSRVRVCSELAVPIKIGPRVIGVLNVESVKLDAFDERDQELFEVLASHAATAMSNLDRAQKLDGMNEKLRVVGGLTRHDVRNKLSTITGNAYLLKKQLAGNSEASNKLEEMEKAVQQAVKILDLARAYEMLGAEELAYTDVEKTVNEASSLIADQNNVKVINDCHGLTVLADSLLRELFYNLIDNSLKHGQKTTRTKVYYEKTDQDSLKLIYEDDGVGIPPTEKHRLFREGYSTGGSTGYGLCLIKKIMEVYGWTIRETGTPGIGARFTITIPKANKHGKENYQVT